jgi:hypothetical protein
MKLEGSCHCGAVRFALESHTPYPFNLCYCSICRKTTGAGGFAINIMGDAKTLAVKGNQHLAVYRARIDGQHGAAAFLQALRQPSLARRPIVAALGLPARGRDQHQAAGGTRARTFDAGVQSALGASAQAQLQGPALQGISPRIDRGLAQEARALASVKRN